MKIKKWKFLLPLGTALCFTGTAVLNWNSGWTRWLFIFAAVLYYMSGALWYRSYKK